ncbi:hypothetical protein EV122DRAFT_282189 [Schizophyllum commune]
MFRAPLQRLRDLLPAKGGGRRDATTQATALNVITLASSLSSMDLNQSLAPLRDVNPATLLGENSSILDPEVLHTVMQSCSPHDLAMLRQTCRAFREHIDAKPALWRSARKSVAGAPEPTALPPKASAGQPAAQSATQPAEQQDTEMSDVEEIPTEAEWALHLFTGALEIKRGFMVIPGQWFDSYNSKWNKSHKKNIELIGDFVRDKEPLGFDARKRRVREFMRTPACLRLLQAFRRDLEDIDRASFERAYPAMVDEIARAKTGDLAMLPAGYRLHARDRVACPECHPPPAVPRPYKIIHKKLMYLGPDGQPILGWKEPKKYMISNGLKDHYEAKHPTIPPALVPVTHPCVACPSRKAKVRLYCAQGMIAHHHKAHGPINPAL